MLSTASFRKISVTQCCAQTIATYAMLCPALLQELLIVQQNAAHMRKPPLKRNESP
ncbi:rCG43999 [Rattus norvegicus]|uniref:RCG43999 n=1 Tax=Rattus norvegicus TaxID=10116 RepID=A6J7K8_RAT|nr:rCG43999 [Rattus norvegicus]